MPSPIDIISQPSRSAGRRPSTKKPTAGNDIRRRVKKASSARPAAVSSPSVMTAPTTMTIPAISRQRRRRASAIVTVTLRRRNTSTGSSRPFTVRIPIGSASTPGGDDGGRRSHDLAAGRLGLEPLRDVHRVADHRVLEPAAAPDRPGDHRPRVEPDAHLEDVDPVETPALAVELVLTILHREGASDRARGVVVPRHRRAEDRHHRVALELVDRAAVRRHHLGHRAEVTADQVGHDAGAEPLGERREPPDVAEQDRDLELDLLDHAVGEPVGDLRRHERPERLGLRALLDHGGVQLLQPVDGGGAVAAGDPSEQLGDAAVDGLLGGAELAGHLLVPQAAAHHVEDPPVVLVGVSAPREPLGDRRVDDAAAGVDLADRPRRARRPARSGPSGGTRGRCAPRRATRSRTRRRRGRRARRRRCRGGWRGSRARSRSPRAGTRAAS